MSPSAGKKKVRSTRRVPLGRVSRSRLSPPVTKPLSGEDLTAKIAELTSLNRIHKRKIFDLYTIFEISRNFNAVLDYNMLLDTFLLTSLAQVGASRAAVFHKGLERTEKMHLVKKRGSGGFPDGSRGFTDDSPLALYLARLNRPVTVSEAIFSKLTDDEQYILALFDGGLVVPLIYQSRLSGVLLVCDKLSRREFTMDDVEFMSILASQISVAIENARLYESEKRTAHQLRAAQQQLVHSERLAALGEMSAKVAHEINNPLGIIKNYILLLKRSLDSNGTANNYADIVGQEIDRIARIVRELLDFHRPGGIAFEKVCLTAIVDNVLNLMAHQLDKSHVEVVKNYDGSLPQVDGAPENLKQVFLNILINACDAMPGGGTLTIAQWRDNDHVTIAFIDSGPGIPPEAVPHIFEPFFTTKETGKGTGLGLSVCYGIVRRHNGTITYANMHPGSRFEVRLPIEQRGARG
jgi:signal transduction histidine kinase